MQEASEEALQAMNAQRERCVAELTDASCDSLVYGCLVALMAQGPGEHLRVTAAIREQLIDHAWIPTVITSADALIEAIRYCAYQLSSVFHDPVKCFEVLSTRKDALLQNDASSKQRSISGLTCLPVTLPISENLLFIIRTQNTSIDKKTRGSVLCAASTNRL